MTRSPTPDQRDRWIEAYRFTSKLRAGPSRFVTQCLQLVEPRSSILELGCGAGIDANAFADGGHIVHATDFVPSVVETNRTRYRDTPNLTFAEMRIDAPYPFPDATFDAIYAHLTLHYFTGEVTREIIGEITRVLRPGGWLLFACKSPSDPAWGRGVEIEPDMFELNGKVRHFFSEDYARNLLEARFQDIEVTSHRGRLYLQRSSWITATARKTQKVT
jgi:SAM-dependent methyltransferase